ncbi:MAG: aromatic amino acid transport family protein [Candidatus Nealsonbacteria bacterium]|nr:aromatic amino acid transport family protein [Candidatus Nealsonbacteria bacterium]
MLKFLKALSVFAGTIIGVGIFGLPFAAAKAGFFVVLFFFLVITVITILTHLLYAEIILKEKQPHRLPGYAKKYLGKKWEIVALASFIFAITGALLAYLIVGGEFLRLLFSQFMGGDTVSYTLLFFVAGAFLIFRGIKDISQVELLLFGIFFVILIIFFFKALPFIDIAHFQSINWEYFTLPYGVILFSLWGLTTVPEVKEIIGADRKLLRKVIISGIILASLTYLFFIVTILGTSGLNTSKEAMAGFYQVLGGGIIVLGFAFGIITCFTSFITLGLVLKKMFCCDLGLPQNLSWFIACFLPLGLFFLGFKEFIDIIGLAGAFGIGVMGIIVVFIYREFLKQTKSKKMNPLLYLLPIFFIMGAFFEVFYYIFAK